MGKLYLYLQEILGRAVNLVEALLAGIRHGLHDGPVQRGGTLGRRVGRCRGRGLMVGSPAGVLLPRQIGGFWRTAEGRTVVKS